MRSLLLILLLFMAQTLSGQNSIRNSIPVADHEEIKWAGTYTYKTNPYDTLYGSYSFYLKELSYFKNGVNVWTIDLPERMKRYEAQSLYDKTTDSMGIQRKLSKEEMDVNKFYHKEFLKCPVFIGERIIALSDRSGFLMLSKQNGAIIVDIPYEYEEDFFRCDQGSFVIKTKVNTCKGNISNGSSFIAACGGNLVHFNEQELFVWNDQNRLLTRMRYHRVLHARKSTRPLHYKALMKNRNFRVEMEGYVFVR